MRCFKTPFFLAIALLSFQLFPAVAQMSHDNAGLALANFRGVVPDQPPDQLLEELFGYRGQCPFECSTFLFPPDEQSDADRVPSDDLTEEKAGDPRNYKNRVLAALSQQPFRRRRKTLSPDDRKRQNRDAAKRSRDRRKEHLAKLLEVNGELRKELEKLLGLNEILRKELEKERAKNQELMERWAGKTVQE